jgi:hypothetical protein
VNSQVDIPAWYHNKKIGDFKADLLVDERVIVELKAIRILEASHEVQLLNYLRATPIEVGLLLNFGLKPQVKRLAFSNDRKRISVNQRSSAARFLSFLIASPPAFAPPEFPPAYPPNPDQYR